MKILHVFYDGACPICRREIGFYQRFKAPLIRWHNIHEARETLKRFDLGTGQALAIFHAIEDQGQTYRALPAFQQVWYRLPYLRHLAFIFSTPLLRGLLDKCYDRFLEKRACSRKGRSS